ncbi:hypothetical protein INS49_007748 [Diaporthe citri]|uniref:uncharacterized protein n=1 Tax=Diaporthe citri TaxID=83186 RepID=UPI001C7FD5D8|nr:uncharacterized protein INS49_007748 [Diaporthe citri]KAG6362656.1 hypothetical protein INS49_007748 [Diaporthe citri]
MDLVLPSDQPQGTGITLIEHMATDSVVVKYVAVSHIDNTWRQPETQTTSDPSPRRTEFFNPANKPSQPAALHSQANSHFLPKPPQFANCKVGDLSTGPFMPTPTPSMMPKDKHVATGKPTAAMSTSYSRAHGQSGMDDIRPRNAFVIIRLTCNNGEDPERGPTNTPSTPHKDGVGTAGQQAPTSQAQSTANASQDNRQPLIDEAITDALGGASTSAIYSLKKSSSAKSKGGAGGGPSRKRDHETMTNASRLANDSGGGSAAPPSSKNPAHDGNNSVQANKFQRILPGPAQLGPAGREQGYYVVNDPANSRPSQAVSGSQAARGANQTPIESLPVIPFLSGQVLAWLPTSLRVAASSARTYVQTMVYHNETWPGAKSGDPLQTQFVIMKDESVLQDWDTFLRALLEVANAAREGRLLDNRPILHNKLTDDLNIRIPDPDRPHGDKQFMHEQTVVPANTQPGQIDASSTIIMGMNPMSPGPGQVGDLSGDIETVMRISSRNESIRQNQNLQLHNLLASQGQAHAQGFHAIQDAYRRADEAREWECDLIANLIKKRSELRDKEEG